MTRVVLITGASSGIGLATAQAFARRGWRVAGTARSLEPLHTVAIPDEQFLPLAADVRDAAAMQRAVSETLAHFGRLDVVVANAGIGQRGAVSETEWEHIEAVLRTNIDGVLHTVRAAVPVMTQGGHVVLVSSIVFNLTSPYTATYSASKAFVSSLARSLRLELEPRGITVTDLRVGRTQTAFNDRRLGNSGRSGGRLPEMRAEQVAEGIAHAVERRQKTVTLRWLDRLIVLANRLIPEQIGRRALRQYKP